MKQKTKFIKMINIMNNPLYRGKHVIVMKDKVFTATTGNEANKVLIKLEKKYPNITPAITYIPKADTL